MSQLILCKRLRTSSAILPIIFKKSTNSGKEIITMYVFITFHFLFMHCTFQNSAKFKTIKNAKNFSVFGENDSHHLFNFLQTYIFGNFDHISRTYNQSNYRNI